MKIISNFILVFSLCATIKYILLEQSNLKEYEKIINAILYGIYFLFLLRILFRLFKN